MKLTVTLTTIVVTLTGLVDYTASELTRADYISHNGDDEAVQLALMFDGEHGLVDGEFYCSDHVSVMVGNVIFDGHHSNCRYCPSIDTATGILVLNYEGFWENEGETNFAEVKLAVDTGEWIQIVPEPKVVDVVSFTIHNKDTLAIIFTDEVAIIRGQKLTHGEAMCDDLVLPAYNTKNCSFQIDDDNKSFVFITINDFEGDLRDASADAIITENTFYAAQEEFGIFPVKGELIELRSPPELQEVTFEEDLTITLTFSGATNQAPLLSVACAEVFEFVFSDEGKAEAESENAFIKSTDFKCSLNWKAPDKVSLFFTGKLPFLSDGTLHIKEDSPLWDVTSDNLVGLAFGSAEVVVNRTFYNVQYTMNHPARIGACDTEFDVQFSQVSGSAIQLDIKLEASNGITCTPIGTSFFRCVIPRDSDFVSFTLNAIEAVDTVFGNRLESFLQGDQLVTVDKDQNTALIPVTIAGIPAGSTVSLERGNSRTFNAVIGDLESCVDDVALMEALKFSWEVIKVTEPNNPEVLSLTNNLKIAGTTLVSANYSITLKVSGGKGLDENEIQFWLEVTEVPLVLVISGGNSAEVGVKRKTVSLDASKSCNPNVVAEGCEIGLGLINDAETDGEIEGNWTCSNDKCKDTIKSQENNTAVLDLDKIQFENDDRVLLEYTFGTDQQIINYQLTVVNDRESCILPLVSVGQAEAKVNIDSPLTLFGAGSFDAKPAEVRWTQIVNNTNELVFDEAADSLRRENLFIPANTLKAGQSYIFQLTARPFREDCADEALPSASTSVAFVANIPPLGGSLSVNNHTGVAAQDQFVFTTTDWVDPDLDTPLSYSFESALLNEEQLTAFESGGDLPITPTILRTFSSAQSFSTTLEIPPDGLNLVVLGIARDSRGAVSARTIANAITRFELANPYLLEDGTINEDTLSVTRIEELIATLSATGQGAEIANLCSSITSALNELTEDQLSGVSEAKLSDMRSTCFSAVQESLTVLVEADDIVDPDVLVQVAASSSSAIQNSDQVDETLLTDVANQADQLLELAQDVIDASKRGDEDPSTAAIIPPAFKVNIMNTVSNLLDVIGTDEENYAGNSNRRRRNRVTDCSVFSQARGTIATLARVENSVVVNGAPPVTVSAASVSLAAQRESLQEIGLKTKTLILQDGAAGFLFPESFLKPQSSTSGPTTAPTLTSGLTFGPTNAPTFGPTIAPTMGPTLAPTLAPTTAPTFGSTTAATLGPTTAPNVGNNDQAGPSALEKDINIVAVKYKSITRCEPRDPVPELECNISYTYEGPRIGKEGSIVSLDFVTFNGSDIGEVLVVKNLTEPIIIALDIPSSIRDDPIFDSPSECDAESILEKDGFSTEAWTWDQPGVQVALCGAFNEETNDYETNGCRLVTETPLGFEDSEFNNKVFCECNHATDYAAWNSFKADAKRTFQSPPLMTELAEKILLTAFPIVGISAFLLFSWAKRVDESDSTQILKGSLAKLKLLGIINKRNKMKFFKNYQEANLQEMVGNFDPSRISTRIGALHPTSDRGNNMKKTVWWRQFKLAIKYEHSLFGLSRFDPNFSRVQRVAVFLSVVVANFGAAALAFELRNGTHAVSTAVSIAVSVTAAFLVSIPIKLLIRLMFRTTENFAGSTVDMVGNMYKIITRVEIADGATSTKDSELVDAIHDYFTKKQMLGSFSKNNNKSDLKGKLSQDDKKRPVQEDGDLFTTEMVAEVVNEDELEYEDILEARQAFYQAKRKLTAVTLSARSAWSRDRKKSSLTGMFYTSVEKVRKVRKQSSRFLKIAAVISDTPRKVAPPRRATLRPEYVYVNWTLLVLILAFYVFYIVKFVSTRSEHAGEQGNATEEYPNLYPAPEERLYMVKWFFGGVGGVIVSYLIAEPLIALMRYVFTPWLVERFGRAPESIDELNPELNQLSEEKKEKNIRSGYAHYGIDVVADLVENLF